LTIVVTNSDELLVSQLKEGSHVAYTEIYNRYSGILYLHAYNKLRDRDEAKDILQELFTNIWNNRSQLIIQTNLASYLYVALRNRILKQISRSELQSNYIASIKNFTADGECITDHLVRQNQLSAIIEKEIDALPPKMREVFLLSRKHHLSHKQIAEQLGIAEPSVKKQVNNALKILRGKLGLIAWLFLLIKF